MFGEKLVPHSRLSESVILINVSKVILDVESSDCSQGTSEGEPSDIDFSFGIFLQMTLNIVSDLLGDTQVAKIEPLVH